MSNRHPNRRWGVGIGTVAAAAAMIGMGIAHADTIDDLLIQAEGDMNDAATFYSEYRCCITTGTAGGEYRRRSHGSVRPR
jgi:hypothetical protein